MLPARPHRAAVRTRVASTRSDSAAEAQRLLLPLILAFVLALLMAWPSQVRAQGAASTTTASTSGTHTVRSGETLWSLAARYYGDGHKWRELASVNGLPEGGERGIVVGQVLRVPGESPSLAQARAAMAEAPPSATPREAVKPAVTPLAVAPAAVAVAPAAVAADAEAPKSAELARIAPPVAPESPAQAATGAPAPLAAPERGTLMGEDPSNATVRVGLVSAMEMMAARGRDNTTIFLGPAPFNADTMQGTIDLMGDESFVLPAGRREGEFAAAPFPVSSGTWKGAGSIKTRAQGSAAVKSREAQRMQPRDLVLFSAPDGMEAAPGTKMLAVSQGADLGSGVRLAMPTAILVVEEPQAGVAVARVMRVYGVVSQGQALLPFEEAPAAPLTADVEAIESRVRWITETPLLPSLQAYLVLDRHDDMQVGDRFELLSGTSTQSRVATVRVVRLSPDGATAIIMHQDQPIVRKGMMARRVGRAP